MLLRTLKLPSFKAHYEDVARQAEREGWTFARYLLHLAEAEVQDRRTRRIERLLVQSRLPKDKTLATLDQKRLPTNVRRQIPALCEGAFVERAENALAFGLPGRGKTHCVSAIGHELVQRGYEVLFRPAFALVQRLLIANRELSLEKELRRLDRFDVVVLDDIGYIRRRALRRSSAATAPRTTRHGVRSCCPVAILRLFAAVAVPGQLEDHGVVHDAQRRPLQYGTPHCGMRVAAGGRHDISR